MLTKEINDAETEAGRLLARIQEVKATENYRYALKNGYTVYGPEAAALKRASLDLTKSLAKLRNNR